MLNEVWTQVLAWSTSLVTPDWGALVARIPLLLLLVVAAFLVITGAKWAAVGPQRATGSRRMPLTADGRELRGAAVGPLVLAAGIAMLSFGLLAGTGWLVAGAITVAVALVGWVAEAWDRPGRRLPRLSRTRAAVIGGIAALALLLLATARVVPDTPGSPSATAAPGASAVTGASGAAPNTLPSALPAADTTLTARGVVYVESSIAAPAGRPFTVAFDNRDSVPHNLEIRDASGATVFRGDLVTGPAVKVYDVPTLTAGAYQFICTVHPAMTGTLTAK